MTMQLWVKNVRKQLDNLATVTDAVNRIVRRRVCDLWRIERRKIAELFNYRAPNLAWYCQWATGERADAIREHIRVWDITVEDQKPLFIEHAGTMQKATIMRALYLELLRSPIVKNNKWSNLQNVAYHKARDTKRELSCKLDSIQNTGVGVYNDKNIRYINLVITTLDKYIRTYLDMKTAVSVEILRVLPDKYIDRYVMEFL